MQENQLYQKIQAYNLDQPNILFTFRQRLTRDNNWSSHYTERVITEYKKFAFLAIAAGHKVIPSDQVDQAWHQHLLDSHSYWEEFCPNVLGKYLHHEPSSGGEIEQIKFVDWYQKTLDSYERLFGYLPPADIWPATEVRFNRDLNFVRINTNQQWLIPKPTWLWPIWKQLSLLPLLILIVVISGCATMTTLLTNSIITSGIFEMFSGFQLDTLLTMNPNLFLSAYTLTGFMLILLAIGLKRYWLRTFEPANSFSYMPLTTESLAYLSGGSIRVIHTAIIALIERGNISADKQYLELIDDSQPQTEMEKAILDALKMRLLSTINRQKITVLFEQMQQHTSSYKNNLITHGLLINNRRLSTNMILLFTPLFLIGWMRLIHSMSFSHPVGFLFILLIMTGLTPFYFCINGDKRTAYGEKVLKTYQTNQHRNYKPSTLSDSVAISGLEALTGTSLWEERQALLNAVSKANVGGYGEGGSCGGCGGCGGGGCGG